VTFEKLHNPRSSNPERILSTELINAINSFLDVRSDLVTLQYHSIRSDRHVWACSLFRKPVYLDILRIICGLHSESTIIYLRGCGPHEFLELSCSNLHKSSTVQALFLCISFCVYLCFNFFSARLIEYYLLTYYLVIYHLFRIAF